MAELTPDEQPQLTPPWPAISEAAWRTHVQAELKDKPLTSLESDVEGLHVAPVYFPKAPSEFEVLAHRLQVEHRIARHSGFDMPRLSRQIYAFQPEQRQKVIAQAIARGETQFALELPEGCTRDQAIAQWQATLQQTASVSNSNLWLLAGIPGSRVDVAAVVQDYLSHLETPSATSTLLLDLQQAPWNRQHATAQASREISEQLARPDDIRLLVSAHTVHDRGGDDATELAYALASVLENIDFLSDDVQAAGLVLAKTTYQLAIGREYFLEIAKFRAFRALVQRLGQSLGVENLPAAEIFAVSGRREWTSHDPWNNLLRATTMAASAMLGGASCIHLDPLDAIGRPLSPLGWRMASNITEILCDESYLTRICDPAHGSAYLESLTEELARSAWAKLCKIQAQGGIAAMLRSGAFLDDLAAQAHALQTKIATGELPLTGVNLHAVREDNLANQLAALTQRIEAKDSPAPGDPIQLSHEFEVLRREHQFAAKQSEREHAVFVANFGALKEYKAKLEFIRGFVGCAGVAVAASPPLSSGAQACEQLAEMRKTHRILYAIICCGNQELESRELADWVQQLDGAGVEVYVAGRPAKGTQPPAKQRGAIYRGSNLISWHRQLLQTLQTSVANQENR